MRNTSSLRGASQFRNLPRDRQAAANRDIGLQHMQSAFNQSFEPPTGHFALARGNRNRRSGAELSIASRVILRERFLQPTDVELQQQPGALQRSLNSKRLSRIDHDIPRISS